MWLRIMRECLVKRKRTEFGCLYFSTFFRDLLGDGMRTLCLLIIMDHNQRLIVAYLTHIGLPLMLYSVVCGFIMSVHHSLAAPLPSATTPFLFMHRLQVRESMNLHSQFLLNGYLTMSRECESLWEFLDRFILSQDAWKWARTLE